VTASLPKGPKGKTPPSPRDDIELWRASPVRKRLNASERRARKAAALQLLVKQVGRKAQKGVEPNDRRHSREVELAMTRLAPDELDHLLRDGEVEETEPVV